MYQDLIIMFGIIFFIYKLITHKGELSLARIIYTFSLVLGLGIFFLRNLISPFTMLFWWIFCMGISLVGMYFMLKNDEFESDKVEILQSNAYTIFAFVLLLEIYFQVHNFVWQHRSIRL